MTVTAQRLASGAGWWVEDVVCTAGPDQRPFEEAHDTFCLAAVTEGTFQYRSPQGSATLAPGTLLLGNAGQCFECGHDHATGDRCLSFHFEPEAMEEVLAAVPGVRRLGFTTPRLPPLPALVPMIAALEAARDEGDSEALEELGLQLAAATVTLSAEAKSSRRSPSWRDERRITAALRRIEAETDEPLSLADSAHAAGMSRYHFLRTFRAVVGLTPHQYLMHMRMRRAAVRLRRSDESVSAIAYDSGFGDLSTFNRQFRRLAGRSPRAYRAASAGAFA
jgi:AraC family transcriptional regulator